MAQKIIVQNGEWNDEQNQYRYAKELEAGNILFFQTPPFPFPQEEIDFLLAQRQGGSGARKNISYKPTVDKVSNHRSDHAASSEKLREVLRNYSKRVTGFLSTLLAPYAKLWKLDYASFRPFQE